MRVGRNGTGRKRACSNHLTASGTGSRAVAMGRNGTKTSPFF